MKRLKRIIRLLAAWLLGLAKAEIRLIGTDGKVLARTTVYLTTTRDSEGGLFIEPLNQPLFIAPLQECYSAFIEADMGSRRTWFQPQFTHWGASDCLAVRIKSEILGDRSEP